MASIENIVQNDCMLKTLEIERWQQRASNQIIQLLVPYVCFYFILFDIAWYLGYSKFEVPIIAYQVHN